MFRFVIGLFGIIVGIILYFSKTFHLEKIALAPAIVGVVICFLSFVSTIPTGHTGIISTMGKVEDTTLPNGLNFHWPWQTVIVLSNKEQSFTESNECFSKDLQEVSYTYTVKYSLLAENAPLIYKTVGSNYFSILVKPQINNAIKAEFGLVAAEDMTKNRNDIQNNINTSVSTYAEQYGISLYVFIDNFDFTDAYTDAIEAKQVAEQEALRDKTQQNMETERTRQQAERAKIEAENAAEVLRINSEADAEAAKIKAQADYEVAQLEADAIAYRGEKEAEAARAMAEVLTTDIIDYTCAQNWNGELPSTILGSDSVPLVNIPMGSD